MSRKLLLFPIICMLFCCSSLAQNRSSVKYAITTQPLQFLVRDLPVTIERVFKRHTLGLTLGYRFSPGLRENPIAVVENYTSGYPASGFTAPRFNGITTGINTKYFLDKSGKIYLEGQVFYRYWWHNTREFQLYKPDVEHNTSSRNHIAGVKFLLGGSLVAPGEKVKMICNFYAGLGYRARLLHEYGVIRSVDYYRASYGPYSPFDRSEKHFTGTFHMGLNVGFAFLSKDKVTE
jgi:hypothetical protein